MPTESIGTYPVNFPQ